MPADAGIQDRTASAEIFAMRKGGSGRRLWIPTFAGMTVRGRARMSPRV